jgi:hypothetical protein
MFASKTTRHSQTLQRMWKVNLRTQMLLTTSRMTFITAQAQKSHFKMAKMVTGQYPMRYFSLPDHVKLEMPNLSPTMEKVSLITYLTLLGKHQKVEPEGW